jgi:hypothetical protein
MIRVEDAVSVAASRGKAALLSEDEYEQPKLRRLKAGTVTRS